MHCCSPSYLFITTGGFGRMMATRTRDGSYRRQWLPAAWHSRRLPGSAGAIGPNVLCRGTLVHGTCRPGRDGLTVTEDPRRRGGTAQTRAPRNRDPREAERGPRVMSCPGTWRSTPAPGNNRRTSRREQPGRNHADREA
jgi:hypothetical protein